jgi:membrane protein involved in colicin uptake
MPKQKLTTEILTAAVLGFEEQKRRIDEQIAEIRQMLDGGRTAPAATPEPTKGKRRKMSAAARKRIGDAQRKRWAESKGQTESPSSPVTAKPKRKMSAAGRKAISDATKKRWAAFHAAKKAEKPAVAKKTAPKKAVAKKAVKAPAKAAQKAAATKAPAKKTASALAVEGGSGSEV